MVSRQSWKVDAVRWVCGSSMNPTADLDTSLAFVIGRIEEEAMRSNQLVSAEQRFLLNHVPNNSVCPYGIALIQNGRRSSYSTERCIRKPVRSSRRRAQQRCAALSGIHPRLGVCCRGFETQPTPDVLALALGEHQDFNGSASVPDALRS
jgi:hypothetical protein